ncbi:TIGR02996 domain-containing protein [Frigoriglobus tundricola]|uniref:TIGR02996 domain-containing protein n=1 Tax=Frigoriglobus tundricola TaxID=2774151 RepID=A0A6M5Z220_9BACT|nr:TIGR02996 domain-containing protein [Frigoriglobus tundricola]QJW99786.1 hypothetical protein FTUN_7409 [Frigoriglobus tundricola]
MNPDDDTPRLVFADWLQEHGEEDRAEFIRVQIELVRKAENPSLKERQGALLGAHRAEWESPFRQFEVANSFRQFVFGVHFRRGFAWAISVNDEEQRFVDNAAALFQHAPIERVNLFHKSQHADLIRCPEPLQLNELLIDRQGFETKELAALLRSKYLTNIKHLDLIADDDNGHLDCAGLELLGRAKTLPALRHLDLSYNYCGWMFSEERQNWIKRLTKGPLIGQLETLKLRSTDVTDECAQILARCKRARSLRQIDLSGNSIGEDGLRAIATSRALSALATLDLRENDYDAEGGGQVKDCPPETRHLLETRFGSGVLLDGKAAPHPIDELFKQFA